MSKSPPSSSAWLHDADVATTTAGQIVHWSKGAELIFGYTGAEAIGQSIHSLIVPPNRADPTRTRAGDATPERTSSRDSIRRRKDGSLLFVATATKVALAPDERTQSIVTTYRDVTHEEVQREAALVGSHLRNLLASMPDAIVVVNAIGRIITTNPQAEELFGYQPGALTGVPVETLLPQRFRDRHVAHQSNYFVQPRARPMGAGAELRGQRSDGTEFPVEISLSPLALDEVTVVMSAIRDASERKRFEDALKRKNVELARANQAKDRFLASMSHELRTPLNAIIGFTGTLLMKLPGPLTADQQKQLETVQSSGRQLLALIDDLLDLAKIDADKFEPALEAVRVRDTIEAIVASLRPQAARKGVELQIRDVSPELVLDTDRRALHQILLNLVNNAVKFTDRGSIGISVLPHDGAPRPTFEFVVEDTGIGIEADDQGRLFEPFLRLVPPGRKPVEGTGLGLHLSQKLAQSLGGRIGLTSEFGKGSRFFLTLPR